MSTRQNLRPLGTVTPGHWYLILSWNSQERWGLHKKRWPLIHMFARFLNLKTFIQQVNIGTKWSLQKHSKVVNTPQKSESERQLRTMTILLVSESLQTHPHRERQNGFLAGKKLFIFIAAFSSAASASIFSITCSFHAHEHQTLSNDRGHTKNDDHFSHVLSRM